ncbi:hypothetical protein [Micromonospora maris]|uniref:hypothetical protein n=1 Tax=Micromonospora maris TaxID=1003110 RepID=UPI000206BD6E|nr:hypothetical protein [Micromonospora maris]AEB43841.1 hypothetical protein VAB18032_13645 [Micromonospora maris AB-18-032]
MSIGEEPYAIRDDLASRPTFEVTLRGYERKQVDRYVEQLDGQLSTVSAERDRALGRARELTAKLQAAQAEVADLRQRPAQLDKATFQDVGPMVGQILDLAEKQAAAIIDTHTQRANKLQAEAEKTLANARERTVKALADLEEELAARRAEHDKKYEELRAAADAELAESRERADKLRADGEAAHERAQQEAHRIGEQCRQQVEQARAAAEALTTSARTQIHQEIQAARSKSQQELAQRRTAVEEELAERRAAAEEDLAEQRAAVERELAAQRSAAEQRVSSMIADAQQYSAEIRKRADEQAAEVRRHSDEQAAAAEEQLHAVQLEIGEQQDALAGVREELDTARRQLDETQQGRETTEAELTRLRQQLEETVRDLAAESQRLDEVRRAVEAAERHAKETRARVQREAKRVADLAAAAVMAAAAGGGETAEYPVVGARAGQRPPTPAAEAEPIVHDATPERGAHEANAGDGGAGADGQPTTSPTADARPTPPSLEAPGGEPTVEGEPAGQTHLGPTVAMPNAALARAEAALAGGPAGINWFAGQPEGQEDDAADRAPQPSTH